MSVVWRAHDRVLGRQVAVKVLAARLAGDADWRRRIRLEARAAARLTHPNITNVYDYGETSDHAPFVVMELLRGPSLAERLRGGPLPPPVAVRICAEVAAGLAAAHAEGLVHRDVKPANVMLTPDAAKVLDFGIVGIVGIPDEDDAEQVLGTPAYLAPERLMSGSVTPASDVYAFGLLLYRCLTGRLPWNGETTTQMVAAHVSVAPAPLPEIPDLPPGVRELCMRCLAKNPADRPEAVVVAARLARAAGIVARFSVVPQQPAPGEPEPEHTTRLVPLPLLPGVSPDATEPAERPGARRRVLLGVGALTGVAALVTAVALAGSDGAPQVSADPASPIPIISASAVTDPTPAAAAPTPAITPVRAEDEDGDDQGGVPPAGTSVPIGGGVVVAACAGKKVSVLQVRPAAELVQADLGVHTKARVELRKAGQRLRYDVICDGGGSLIVSMH
ncbi:serine/threonine-protein kinase [Dactylosporangium sp. CA-233914]|uniref:serine/threonine-protein kinase n=1 Tax=Dactylosporangium sp. CA-233914 TaxID=3239934 RepID=UPI003D90D76E